MTMGGKKVVTRGRRSKNKEWAKKMGLVAKSGFEIKVHGTHCWRSVRPRIVFLSFNLQQIPSISE
jgi:hypothetical protein